MNALRIAATGMLAQELNVEVISNNIANLRTTGFKKVRAEFQDLLYQDLRRAGATASQEGSVVPTGIQVGFGVKTGATSRIMTQGGLASTDKDLDIAIRGDGYFPIEMPNGQVAYTRDGSFQLDAEGQIVTADGFPLEPGLTVPDNAKSISINQEGVVEVQVGDEPLPQQIGQIQLARFVNKGGLQAIGENLFLETPASGQPQLENPATEGTGSLLQKFLENSNVNAVAELSDLISAQRAYEMNAKIISAADEMMSATTSAVR
jgi:flagellar basal-body rod protein FlgG